MTKNILIINGHPNSESFNYSLAREYKKGVGTTMSEVKEINIGDLVFNPNLERGYRQRMDLEPDLLLSIEKIMWADHLVWIHPVWWGGLPAITKGFIDRVFLPGITYGKRENSMMWDKLLKGKTARIITTLDQPGWFYRFYFGRPSVNQLKKATLGFCGVKTLGVTYVGVVKTSTKAQRLKWLKKVNLLGRKLC